MPWPSQCIHHRNTVSFDTCKAGIRYSEIAGTQRDKVGDDTLAPGKLPCWHGPVDGREECPVYEPLGDEAADVLS